MAAGRAELLDVTDRALHSLDTARDALDLVPVLLGRDRPRTYLLMMQTSGELRGSNFLIWQGAYSEWFFPAVYWPDFDKEQLRLALQEYGHRERRYGRVAPVKDNATA